MATATLDSQNVRAVIIDGPEAGRIVTLPIDEAKNALAARELAAAEEALDALQETMKSPNPHALRELEQRLSEIKRRHGIF